MSTENNPSVANSTAPNTAVPPGKPSRFLKLKKIFSRLAHGPARKAQAVPSIACEPTENPWLVDPAHHHKVFHGSEYKEWEDVPKGGGPVYAPLCMTSKEACERLGYMALFQDTANFASECAIKFYMYHNPNTPEEPACYLTMWLTSSGVSEFHRMYPTGVARTTFMMDVEAVLRNGCMEGEISAAAQKPTLAQRFQAAGRRVATRLGLPT